MMRSRFGKGVLALAVYSVCVCPIGCRDTPAEPSVHEMTLAELRRERGRLQKAAAEIGYVELVGRDARKDLMFEVACLRAALAIYRDSGAPARRAPAGAVMALPDDPLQLTVVQRESKPIPGSGGTVELRVDDVTGGQVLVEVVPRSGPPLVNMVSMTPGDVVTFRVDSQAYHLTLTGLRNFLIGDDFAVFEVSTRPPSEQRLRALRAAAQPPKATQPATRPADRGRPGDNET